MQAPAAAEPLIQIEEPAAAEPTPEAPAAEPETPPAADGAQEEAAEEDKEEAAPAVAEVGGWWPAGLGAHVHQAGQSPPGGARIAHLAKGCAAQVKRGC